MAVSLACFLSMKFVHDAGGNALVLFIAAGCTLGIGYGGGLGVILALATDRVSKRNAAAGIIKSLMDRIKSQNIVDEKSNVNNISEISSIFCHSSTF